MPPFKIEPDIVDDDRYTFTPGLGTTRTGPRRPGYWDSCRTSASSHTRENQSQHDTYRPIDRQDSTGSIRKVSSASWEPNRTNELLREQWQSTPPSAPAFLTVQVTPPRGLSTVVEERLFAAAPESPIDTLEPFNHCLIRMFAESQRNRTSDKSGDNPFDYRDDRRSDEHLPSREELLSRRIKKEPVEDQNVHGSRRRANTSTRNAYQDDRRAATSRPQRPSRSRSDSEDRLFFRDTSAATLSGDQAGSSSRASSTGSTSSTIPTQTRNPTPEPPPPTIRLPRLPDSCVCPINLECPARHDTLIDCRTLVIEKKEWERLQGEGGAEAVPADDDVANEELVSVAYATRIVRLIDNINRDRVNTNALRSTFTQIEIWIAEMAKHSISEDDLNASNALPTITAFLDDDNTPNRNAKRVPISIEESLTILMRKWNEGDYSQRPRRGLLRSGNSNNLYPDPEWPHRRPNSSYFGHGRLVNGQKWLTRAAMSRDGAHGALQAGINGTKSFGAYSVVMGYHNPAKRQYYADVDCGNRIWYISTALPDPNVDAAGQPISPSNLKDPEDRVQDIGSEHATSGAQALIKSSETRNPVRVFRSWKASKLGAHRPQKGYRYDGLYEVVNYELIKVERQIYKFEMVRLRERNVGEAIRESEWGWQGPIRSGMVAEPISAIERLRNARAERANRAAAQRAESRARRR